MLAELWRQAGHNRDFVETASGLFVCNARTSEVAQRIVREHNAAVGEREAIAAELGEAMSAEPWRVRAEKNAERALWAMHILGPDDVIPMPSYAEALRQCDALNRSVWSREGAPDDVLAFAIPAVWAWTKDEHAEALARHKRPISA